MNDTYKVELTFNEILDLVQVLRGAIRDDAKKSARALECDSLDDVKFWDSWIQREEDLIKKLWASV